MLLIFLLADDEVDSAAEQAMVVGHDVVVLELDPTTPAVGIQ